MTWKKTLSDLYSQLRGQNWNGVLSLEQATSALTAAGKHHLTFVNGDANGSNVSHASVKVEVNSDGSLLVSKGTDENFDRVIADFQ